MALDFWTRTSGTWINIATILIGTGLGLMLRGRLPLKMQKVITQGVGLIVLYVGISMAAELSQVKAGQVAGMIVGLVAIVIGGLLGEYCEIEERLTVLGDWLKHRFKGKGSFTEGFVAASLLFCIGPMALLGSLNNGLTGDNTILTLKASMDGLAAIALTSSYGIGSGFSVLPILVYQGSMSLAAGFLAQALPDPAHAPQVVLLTGVGGLMIMGLGFNLLQMGQIRVASFLPALLLTPIFYGIADWVSR